MIISATPFRMSFFGGGTDYPEWYRSEGGAVLSTTFDKYTYITCRNLPPFFDHKHRITYSKVEHVQDVSQIQHRAVRAVLQMKKIDQGLEIHCDADLPARSGLGSSSSFVVGLLNALAALGGARMSKAELTYQAIHVEQNELSETVGSQDQAAAAFGGFNVIYFNRDMTISVEPVLLCQERKDLLNDHLMLFFTGFSRTASDVAKAQVINIKDKSGELQHMRQMVDEAMDILTSGKDIRQFGELLDLGWQFKRSLSDQVSSAQIDNIYARARQAGAIGGKLLGAGGGGFMLLFVPPEKQSDVRYGLSELVHVPFRFESSGSRIVHYQP